MYTHTFLYVFGWGIKKKAELQSQVTLLSSTNNLKLYHVKK